MNVFAEHDAIPFSARRFHVACLCHSLHGKHGFSLKIDFYWYELCAHFLHGLFFVQDSYADCYAENPVILLDAD